MRTTTLPTTAQLQTCISNLRVASQDGTLSTAKVKSIGREAGLTGTAIKSGLLLPVYKIGRGQYRFDPDATLASQLENIQSSIENAASKKVAKAAAPTTPVVTPSDSTTPLPVPANSFAQVTSISNDEVYIPNIDSTYIPWGEFNSIKKIISSELFFPVYIAGMSGNGKTFMVEQACARLKREYVRVQISPETDEDDLLGGFRLINGETVFQKGPVFKAMEQGAILLIDEIDRGTNKILCLQSVLEGKPVLVKKTGQTVTPAKGFNVIATANTMGRGSDDGRYSGANIIDDAFIERFVMTVDQPYPEYNVEKKIVTKHMELYDIDDADFTEKLVSWSAVIRKTFEAEGVDEVISTRRLCHIIKAHSIFNNRLQAIKACITRFDSETREAFLDLYTKIDSGELKAEDDENSNSEEASNAETVPADTF